MPCHKTENQVFGMFSYVLFSQNNACYANSDRLIIIIRTWHHMPNSWVKTKLWIALKWKIKPGVLSTSTYITTAVYVWSDSFFHSNYFLVSFSLEHCFFVSEFCSIYFKSIRVLWALECRLQRPKRIHDPSGE